MNLASMLIVVPMITSNKVIYGIYSICISTAIFLNYADLGFFSASVKYAGESYARNDRKSELSIWGFSSFILLIFVGIISLIYLYLSFFPQVLIKDDISNDNLLIASNILLIQAIFSVFTVFSRYLSGVFQVRIEQYVYKKMTLIGALIKIASVYYFFRGSDYDIVGYFLFSKIVDVFVIFAGFIFISRNYELPLIQFFKRFKFDRSIYTSINGLAYGSLYVSILWIFYYELDLIIIGKYLGAESAAVYALAFTFMKFLRTVLSVVFSPFQNRYNHLLGMDDYEGFKNLLYKVIKFSMPIFTFLAVTVVLLRNNLILCWAGPDFYNSAGILGFLAMNYIFTFITIPSANSLVALTRIKDMYVVSTIMVATYWLGVLFTLSNYGVYVFAIFKLISGLTSMVLYLRILLKILNTKLLEFIRNTILTIVIPTIIQIASISLIINWLPAIKGKVNLLIVIGAGAGGCLIAGLALYLISQYYRTNLNFLFAKLNLGVK